MNQENNNKTEKNLITLLNWYRLKRVNEFAAQCDETQAWESIQQCIRHRKRIRMYTYWSSTAAACLLIAAFSFYTLTEYEQSLFTHRGEQKATLFVNNGESYNLLSQDKSIFNANGMQVAQNTEKELRYDTQANIEKNTGKHILNVPRGGEYKLVLSDGTRVHANAESRLTYPVSFTGSKREVYLTGEALFEVAKDTLHPFIVHTPYGIVEVVGTRFNVNTYEKNQTTVTLEEGAVKVYCEDKKEKEQKSLSPGEQAIIQSKTINTQPVQVQEYTSWANGVYEYTDTSLETIVQQLSRWYNVNMTFTNPQLRERKFAGVIFRDQPLQKAVDILSKVSNVYFRQKGNIIEITENRPQY